MKKESSSSISDQLEDLKRENRSLKEQISVLKTLVRALERGCACYLNNKKFSS